MFNEELPAAFQEEFGRHPGAGKGSRLGLGRSTQNAAGIADILIDGVNHVRK